MKMSVGQKNNSDRQERINRVKRLKKMILILAVVAIVIPTILCVLLFIRLHQVERIVQSLYETKALEQIKRETKEVASEHSIQGNILQDMSVSGNDMDVAGKKEQNYGEDTRRKVYLTFDDGPSANTSEILDILAEYHVKATFFVVGKTDDMSIANYKRIVAEGHTLGMHSYSHKYNEIYASREDYVEDLTKLQNYLYDITGVKAEYVRFPGGSSNQVSKVDMQELISYLKENDITYFDWNISSGDADGTNIGVHRIVNNCMGKLEEFNNEAMILMHDANDKKSTVEALPIMIEQIQKMDDTVILPITDDTIPIQHLSKAETVQIEK